MLRGSGLGGFSANGALAYVLAADGAPLPDATGITGTTAETAFATISLPALAMGPKGILRITAEVFGTVGGNNKTFRVRMGNGLSGTIFRAVTMTTLPALRDQIQIHNRGANNSQIAHLNNGVNGGFGVNGTAGTTGSVDTSVAQIITLSGQLAVDTDFIRLESYLIELLRPPV